ncbi:MAG: PEPxxWA-CTERM sorting domain-containing protein [Phenylobacterium sp.]|nr:PEPxxWA-CTERM sorting domain-containing protein [Phenylobacterium sp.]MDP3749321.1 PEPxxWA-CTERM sorting domain-containing protein [Phenylobacterium sp.]
MNFKLTMAAAVATMAFGLAAAAPASAATIALGSECSNGDIDPVADDCSGWWTGTDGNSNLLTGTASDIADQIAALAELGFVWDGNWAAVDTLTTKISPEVDGFTYDFDTPLNGTTYIGIHKGVGGSFDGTAFFKLTANNLDTFKLNLNGGSSAVLYQTGGVVPEPATWAMMIIGFGAAGTMLRSNRRKMALAAI